MRPSFLGLDANNPNCDHHRYKHCDRETEYDTEFGHLAVTLWRRMPHHLLPSLACARY
jgi:hypothetical protein